MKRRLLPALLLAAAAAANAAQGAAMAPVGLDAGPGLVRLAASGDGRWLIAAHAGHCALALLGADLALVRSYPAPAPACAASAQPARVLVAPARRSFVLLFVGASELWEISYDPQAEPIFDGLVHDYRSGEAIPRSGFLGVRKTQLDTPLDDGHLLADGRHLIGISSREPAMLQVVNLDVRRRIATVQLAGLPHPGGAVPVAWQGGPALALPDCHSRALHVIDSQRWTLLATIEPPGADAQQVAILAAAAAAAQPCPLRPG